jgi:hypothetical protein
MLDFETFKIIHRHGSDNWAEFRPREHHDAADHDPERDWGRGAQIFRCESCEEEIAVVPREGGSEKS